MYTAIQARNIANEKYNHNYYRRYRWYCGTIMRGITRGAKRGDMRYKFTASDNRRINRDVLTQIAQELTQLGYNATIGVEATQDKKRKYTAIYITWA
jgi:hypothetical protein